MEIWKENTIVRKSGMIYSNQNRMNVVVSMNDCMGGYENKISKIFK